MELGAVMTEGGQAVWAPNPDADPGLFDAFRACLSAARQTPESWALHRGEALPAMARSWLAPVMS